MKNECVYGTVYVTKAQARRDVIAYIEGFYNNRRRHSALDYRLPNEVQYSYEQPTVAAHKIINSAVRNPRNRSIAPLKTWRILHTDYRRPTNTFPETITTTIGLRFYRTQFL
ncbi:hypothetical protein GCM10022198_12500 [Klugiella xanthotipulae]